jgi:hypothetical protein
VDIQVESLLATVDEDIPVNFQPCDVSKDVHSLKIGKACGFNGIPNEFIGHFPRRPLVRLTHFSITAFGLVTSQHPGRKQNYNFA